MYVLSVVSINYPRGTYKLSNSVPRAIEFDFYPSKESCEQFPISSNSRLVL